MRIYQVDAFTSQAFRGNPAAVCLLDGPRPDDWLRALAGEMNLSETACLLREGDGWRLRWFTPLKEVSLCGHATLASAHILWSEGYAPAGSELRFETLSGTLTARQDGTWVQLDFPVRRVEAAAPDARLLQALGGPELRYSGVSRAARGDYWLLELADAGAVRMLAPDFTLMAQAGARGVIVTALSDDPAYDFVSRFFAPLLGVNEDPVTGSAHCYLAPYWEAKLGKADLLGWQCSARGGAVGCRRQGERVFLRGQAVTILRGELVL